MKLILNKRRGAQKALLILIVLLFNSVIANSIPLPEGTDAMVKNVEKFESGKIKSVFLVEPTSIQTPIGKLTFFTEKNDFGGNENNSKVEFYESGSFKSGYLKDKTLIKTPAGKYSVQFISFYEDGKLEKFMCPIEYNVKVQGRSFTKTAKTPPQIKTNIGLLPVGGIVELYSSGKIKKVTLSNEYFYKITSGILKGIEITELVEFFENGNISTTVLSKPQVIKSNFGKINAHKLISFWENGTIKNVEFPEAQTIDTSIGYLQLVGVSTYESGKIEKCLLDDGRKPNAAIYSISAMSQEVSTKWGKFNISSSSPICFYEDGSPQEFNLGKNYNLSDAPKFETSVGTIKVWQQVKFYKTGSVKSIKAFYLEKAIVTTSKGDLQFDELFFYDTGEFMGGLVKQKYAMFAKDGKYLGIAKYDAESSILKISE